MEKFSSSSLFPPSRTVVTLDVNKLSKASVSQLVNAEVNSGNRKAVLASNYATRIRGRHATLRECILYKQLNYTLLSTMEIQGERSVVFPLRYAQGA